MVTLPGQHTPVEPVDRRSVLVVTVVMAAAATAAFLLRLAQQDGDAAAGVVAFVVGGAVMVVLARILMASEPDSWISRLALVAVAAKLVGIAARYLMVYGLYGGGGDATLYAANGVAVSQGIAAGDIPWGVIRSIPGSGFIDLFTGIVFTVTTPTGFGGFVVFGLLSFVGQLLFYRAFRQALDPYQRRVYAVAILLMPSLLFWPASIGKEAWLMFTLGIGAVGAVRLLSRQPGGLVIFGLGLVGTAAVRPHVALLLVIGFVAGALATRQGPPGHPLRRVALLVVGVGVGAILAGQVSAFFEGGAFGNGGVFDILEVTATRTSQGGSEFEAIDPTRWWMVPVGLVNVLFRPFPFEATNAQALVASLEGTALLVICLRRGRGLAAAVRNMLNNPHLGLAGGYCATFIFAFSTFGNFGIIARQRSLLFPFFLFMLSWGWSTSGRRRASVPAGQATADSRSNSALVGSTGLGGPR